MSYTQPISYAYTQPAYPQQPPQVQVQQAPPRPAQQNPSQQHLGGGPYDGQQHAQQLTPYAAAPGAAYSSPGLATIPSGQAYFPPAPVQSNAALVPAPAQLHPQEAHAIAAGENPYAPQRPRTSSTASHRSHHSTASHRSKASSRFSGSNEPTRKPGQRATLGDTLVGMWRVVRDLIPTDKR